MTGNAGPGAPVDYRVEDHGEFRRLYAKGPHTHSAFRVCHECSVDLPFTAEFLRQFVRYSQECSPDIVFRWIEGRLCNDAFNCTPRELLRRFRPDLTGCSVLDFGAGLGQFAAFLADKGAARICVAEIDARLLSLSRTYLNGRPDRDKFRYILVEQGGPLAAIEEASLDVIVASDVFEHVLPRLRASTLADLYSRLRPGGMLILTTPNRLFPKDNHTTGLWFATWLPAHIAMRYARTFSRRCARWTPAEFHEQGLTQYSYFEARRVLKPRGALDLCTRHPKCAAQILREIRAYSTFKTRAFLYVVFGLHCAALRFLGPWEAWLPTVDVAWQKPAGDRAVNVPAPRA